jgi:hypothetical protein
MRRECYSVAGWRWLLACQRKVKNCMVAAELFYIALKET